MLNAFGLTELLEHGFPIQRRRCGSQLSSDLFPDGLLLLLIRLPFGFLAELLGQDFDAQRVDHFGNVRFECFAFCPNAL